MLEGKTHFKAGLAGFGFKFNFAAMPVADDAIADDKSEACSGPDGFGREERLKHVCLNFRWNARTAVDDFNQHLVMVERSADANFSFSARGGDGVVDQIRPDLFEFAAISHDARHRA